MLKPLNGKLHRRVAVAVTALSATVVMVLAVVYPLAVEAVSGGAKTATFPARDWYGAIPAEPTEAWELAFGARLYDSWALTLGANPIMATNPNYPKSGKMQGYGTWRCKECHGWDYKGANGAYGKGSHKTGIKGLGDMAGGDLNEIQKILMDSTHGYSRGMIPAEAMKRLALFVAKGQTDYDRLIDRATGKARGNAARGRALYQNLCASCHGFDGTSINFSAGDIPEYVGTVAFDNPWSTLHKILNGQPGSPMPAFRGLPMEVSVDILAYAQSLPVK